MNDIIDREDIELFVDAFYAKVRKDDLIGPIFNAKIMDWGPHLERMYSFWNTILFAKQDYRGNPFSKHSKLPIHAPHFKRWIDLLSITIDEHFKGDKAEEVKIRATKMGDMFQYKLEVLRSNDQYYNLI